MKKILQATMFLLTISQCSVIAEKVINDTNGIRYGQAYFSAFQPITLIDMIKKVPGGLELLKSASGNNARGFGASGSQILIDGKRTSGKTNDMQKTLSHILASQVDYIQLIRGTAEGLDVRSEGLILNVVLKSDINSLSSNLIKTGIQYVKNEDFAPTELLIAHNSTSSELKYGISYQYSEELGAKDIPENIYNDNGTQSEFVQGRWDEHNKKHLITANLGYLFGNGDFVNLNALLSDREFEGHKQEEQFLVTGNNEQTFVSNIDKAALNHNEKWEIGGDYESDFGDMGILKVLIILNQQKAKGRDTNYSIIDDEYITDYRYFTDTIKEEYIIRSSFTKELWAGYSLEYGIEGALNKVDKTTNIDDTPTLNTVVTEDRYELFLTQSWTITSQLSSQFTLTKELSEIHQLSDFINNTRSFNYLKPRLELRYDLNDKNQIRFVADRTVSQLNLTDFIVSRNEEDETMDFGNPDLVPYKKWFYSLGYEHQLENNAGSLEAQVFYEDFTDHIDKIQIDELSSGVGNIGDARLLGVELEANVTLGFVGIPGALISTTYKYLDSDTTDPFTGEKRPIKQTQTHFMSLDFRHDLVQHNISYGINVHRRSPMYRTDISIYEVRSFKYHFNLFADYLINPNLKLHFAYHYPLNDRKLWNKTIYDGYITDNIIDQIEKRTEYAERKFKISLQMAF